MSVFGSGIRPWKRQTETKRAADSSVPGKGELVVSDAGKVYAGDGATQAKNLSPMLRKTDADTTYAPKPGGTPTGVKFLGDDNTWKVPPSGGETDTAGSEIDYAESNLVETLTGAATDIPGMAITFATGDNPAMVEFYPAGFYGTAAGAVITYQITRASDGAVLATGVANIISTAQGYDFPATISKRIPAGTASDTYKAQAWRSAGGGTITVNPGVKTMYLQAKAL